MFCSTDGTWVWAFGLYPDDGKTRLVSRNRIAIPNASFTRQLVNLLVMEPGSLVMEAKMLNGIKERAERLSSTSRWHGSARSRRRPEASVGLPHSGWPGWIGPMR